MHLFAACNVHNAHDFNIAMASRVVTFRHITNMVHTVISIAGDDVDSMAAVASAYTGRSLDAFQAALTTYSAQLTGDPLVHRHLQARQMTTAQISIQALQFFYLIYNVKICLWTSFACMAQWISASIS